MNAFPLLAAAGFAAVSGLSLCARDASIAVSSTVLPEYVQTRSAPDHAETYVLIQGQFFNPNHERKLTAVDFRTIVIAAAGSLAEAGYLPAGDSARPGLVIAVHWGVTEAPSDNIQNSAMQDLQSDLADYNNALAANGQTTVRTSGLSAQSSPGWLHGEFVPPTPMYADYGMLNASQGAADRTLAYNAQLLGFSDDIAKAGSDRARASRLTGLLGDERYFLILQAYDRSQLRPGGKPVPLWTTRVSAPAAGHGFAALLPAFCRETARYAGRPTAQVQTDTIVLGP